VIIICFNQIKRTRLGIAAGAVECLTGDVRVYKPSRSTYRLGIGGRNFGLPIHFWHVGNGLPYRVYIVPASKRIIAMEPA
jgi:hypothetical protein